MPKNKGKIKIAILTFMLAFTLMFSFYVPADSLAQDQKSAEEQKEYYKKLYEQMKKKQEKKKKETAKSGDSDKKKKKKMDKKKAERLKLIRKREEARRKAKEDWLNQFRENTAKLTVVDKAPDLSKSKKAPEGMTYIPKGKFMRGQDWGEWTDNQPSQVIYLNPYYIDTYEVTAGQYKAYLKELKKPIPFFLKAEDMGGDNQPVFKVNWQKAVEYCEHLGKRLPTEAEWEKAARGWDSRYYSWGNEMPNANGEYRANYSPGGNRGDDGFLYTGEVGSYPKGMSPYGLHDMSGNIAEWTADWFDEEYYKVKTKKNPKGPKEGTKKVVRGGGYDVPYNNLLLTIRLAAGPKTRNNFIGFRCAKDAK